LQKNYTFYKVILIKFKRNLLFISQNPVQQLKAKYVSYLYQWSTHCKELIAGKKLADSENRLATIEPKMGISLLLLFKQVSSIMPISATISANSRKPLATTKHRIGFQQKMRENYQL
jgi:hypothetical protein